MSVIALSAANALKDCAFKGLISPPSEPPGPGEIMSFGVSPVNYSDSRIKG